MFLSHAKNSCGDKQYKGEFWFLSMWQIKLPECLLPVLKEKWQRNIWNQEITLGRQKTVYNWLGVGVGRREDAIWWQRADQLQEWFSTCLHIKITVSTRPTPYLRPIRIFSRWVPNIRIFQNFIVILICSQDWKTLSRKRWSKWSFLALPWATIAAPSWGKLAALI